MAVEVYFGGEEKILIQKVLKYLSKIVYVFFRERINQNLKVPSLKGAHLFFYFTSELNIK